LQAVLTTPSSGVINDSKNRLAAYLLLDAFAWLAIIAAPAGSVRTISNNLRVRFSLL